jgi:hypothetical protein
MKVGHEVARNVRQSELHPLMSPASLNGIAPASFSSRKKNP